MVGPELHLPRYQRRNGDAYLIWAGVLSRRSSPTRRESRSGRSRWAASVNSLGTTTELVDCDYLGEHLIARTPALQANAHPHAANPEIRGNTVDQYENRVRLILADFFAWKADRSAWERDVAARQIPRTAIRSNAATNASRSHGAAPTCEVRLLEIYAA